MSKERLPTSLANGMSVTDRRGFLRNSALLAGATAFSAAGTGAARAQKLEVPQSEKEMGRIIEPESYGAPSKFEAHVKRRRTDVLVNSKTGPIGA